MLLALSSMLSKNQESDIAIAKRICEGLRSGVKECLGGLVATYNEFFHNFARRRLFRPDMLEDVIQNFWEEMLSGQAICAYADSSENSATLRTYLVGVLYRRVIDANRKTSRYEEVHREEEHLQGKPDQAVTPHNGLSASASATLARQLVHEALLKLSEDSPTDASLVRMHLEGLDYSQMATRLGKRRDAIKKQFTREPTGSLAKFKRTLNYLMQAQGLQYEDL
jgi:RNA polymerase sigma factor (sigma-70 family)